MPILLADRWWSYRQTHSITEDAFVEAHITNVAPQTVSGHTVRVLAFTGLCQHIDALYADS